MVLYANNENGPWDVVETVVVEGNGGQRAARKQVAENHEQISKAIEEGDTVILAAVPESSWKPTPATVETSKRLVV